MAVLVCCLLTSAACCQEAAVRWWEGYTGVEADGPHVLGFWKFDGDSESFIQDSSSHGHQAKLRGAKRNGQGRFGGCLESAAGYPVIDESHGLQVAASPVLSSAKPLTLELWIRAKDAEAFPDRLQSVLLDCKYVPQNHTGFMLSLTQGSADGSRRLSVEIGTGTDSHRWYSQPLRLTPNVWQHIALTYDSRGTVAFFVDGAPRGKKTVAGAGPMAAAARPLSIGDRLGSLYKGFPGFIDEVRITEGIREFQPVAVIPDRDRFVFVRMGDNAKLTASLVNQTGAALSDVIVTAHLPGRTAKPIRIPALTTTASHRIDVTVDSSLRPGVYEARIDIKVAGWGGGDGGHQSSTTLRFVITPRPMPHRMPVVMWGLGGTDGVVKEIPRLKEIGFTHCLGLSVDYQQIWDQGAAALPSNPETIRQCRDMLDTALENDVQIVASLSPGRWLRTAKVGRPFLRIDREGKHYDREDISGTFPNVQEFCFNVGAAMGRAYGDHPAFASALLHTEVRGESQVSFHPIEIEAYRRATGAEAPQQVAIKNGVQYQKLEDFPNNRVIADRDPILQYLQWFWKEGDGWNNLHTQLHKGLRENISRPDFWTFHDPAVRVPSLGGSGGGVDVLSHWTYSYPDPVRIGLCTDELLEMARTGGRDQDVMKMTQLIWYRSQTAPKKPKRAADTSPWVDRDPDADYITIAPMHLREALWWKISRPIKGIMYHGWQSLVDTESPGAYRYTNPNSRHELRRLIDEVIVPLGPMLLQIPDPESDVAFLESFTSQMFARRGTYGWNRSWAGDMYHILMYAQLQPRVMYEESLLAGQLDDAKVVVLADCDVLTESAANTIQQFQADGGLVIGDADVCPAIQPDLVVPRVERTKRADEDRQNLLAAAQRLRQELDSKYSRAVDSSNSDVVTRRRVFGTTDYVFAVNDRREFGTYVGPYGLVMEDGLPAETTLRLKRESGFVYDLLERRELSPKIEMATINIPLKLGPCEGRILMVTQRPIREVNITAPDSAGGGDRIRIDIEVTDGRQPIDAVVPLEVRLVDPEGVQAEFSGHYGAVNGRQSIAMDVAPNDRIGLWKISARELASGRLETAYIRIGKGKK